MLIKNYSDSTQKPNTMDLKVLLLLLGAICCGIVYGQSDQPSCSVSYVSPVRRYRSCGRRNGPDRTCRYTTYQTLYRCCNGWGGSMCNIPVCKGGAHSTSCSVTKGNVVYKNDTVVTTSGGFCSKPYTCIKCNHGYFFNTLQDGFCDACRQILNCNIKNCTRYEDTVCDWCVGELARERNGFNVYTGRPDNTMCQRACSWRDGYRCFPGTCTGDMVHERKCKCTVGFGGNNCATANAEKLPTILEQLLVLEGDGLIHKKLIMDIPTANGKYWTNEPQWKNISVTISSTYKPEIDTTQGIPSYIQNYTIGIKELTGTTSLTREDNGTETWYLHGMCNYAERCHVADTKNLQNMPWNTILEGGFPEPFEHGDIVTFKTTTKNGGHVDYIDRDVDTTKRYYIIGIEHSITFELEFDYIAPGHCYEDLDPCSTEPLDVTDFNTQSAVTARWGGWYDDDAGIIRYDFNIFYLAVQDHNTGLLEPKYMLEEVSVNYTESSTTLKFTASGPYAVDIIAHDRAGNHKTARRIVLFDDDSKVEKKADLPKVLQANDAFWITAHSDKIGISWTGRYINIVHHNLGWLNAVKEQAHVSSDLDDHANISRRNIENFHNIEGVVRFDIAYEVELGGVMRYVDFFTVPDELFDHEKMIITDEAFDDGKKITFTVRGVDALESYAEDNVTVKIDLSPPIVERLWLTKGDVLNISVHNLIELKEMTFEWEVYDTHSGLYQISWRLVDNYTHTDVVHGTSYESPRGQSETLTECANNYGSYPRGHQCYCTPYDGCFHKHFQLNPMVTDTGADGLHHGMETGVHDSDYFLEVTAINNARLATVQTLKITIDTSPPHEGSVHDGNDGEPEIDFQQSLKLSAYWEGFFDMESGVWFYLYSVQTECKPAIALDIHMFDSQVYKTYESSMSFTVDGPGTYYVSVVAYNHALDSSNAVCSDGVTVDNTSAVISEVVVKNAVTTAGLFKDEISNVVYILNKNREVEKLSAPAQLCVDKATSISSEALSLFPHKRLMNGTKSAVVSTGKCTKLPNARNPSVSFLTSTSHLDISWNVTSGGSGVYDFHVGIASTQSQIADIMTFVSTHGHQHKRLVHPDLFNGEEVYIVIKSTTKSNVVDFKTVGPFLVDSSPPEFQGHIDVSLERANNDMWLIATWSTDAFEDNGDPNPLKYEYAIGTTRFAKDVIGFEPLSQGGSCSSVQQLTTCTAVSTTNLPWYLHGSESYYITIKASNVIGLFTLASSDAYIHNHQLASEGVVYDINVDVSNELSDIDDVDFQTSRTALSTRWGGFQHPHENIKFHVCIKIANSSSVITCAQAQTDNTHTFENLNLLEYKTYVQVVIGETEAGNVTAVSDGVTIVLENDTFEFMQIKDGPYCNQDTLNDINITTSHHDEDKRLTCSDDIEYQRSTSVLEAHWTIPANMAFYIHDAFWAVEERAPIAEFWRTFRVFEHLRSTSHLTHGGLVLTPGRRYRVVIKFCASDICFEPLYSNGVTIVANPPVAGNLNIIYNIPPVLTLGVTADKFYDPDIEDIGEAEEALDHYEWAIANDGEQIRLVGKWIRVETLVDMDGHIQFDIQLSANISFTKCWKILIRGYNKAGLSTDISAPIKPCEDVNNVRPSVVIDVVGSPASPDSLDVGTAIHMEENDIWPTVDADYTPYTNILSAVWPNLRHKNYTWGLLEIKQEDPSIFYKDIKFLDIKDPCSHPDTMRCGNTDVNYVNVLFNDGELHHGRRYVLCIHANATSIEYEYWTQKLEEISSCSDGITIDLTPPQPADVWIGNDMTNLYQVSSNELSVNWNSFLDVEEEGFSSHASGIQSYTVAIGTDAGLADIVAPVNVGLRNHITFHDLELQNGYIVYAIVTGIDFIGRSEQSVSSGVMVDTTPPVETERTISVGGLYITDTSYVQACWTGLFEDKESGIMTYFWSIGSIRRLDDKLKYSQTDEECARTTENDKLQLQEGHAYFVNVKAFNRAGLFAVTSSWAFVVDASPPIAGHVYDGPLLDGVYNDLDYGSSNSKVQAHWKGFHDPHTTIHEYYISVGSCKSCQDVVSNQPIGIRSDIEIDMVHMAEGLIHYVTITACNTAGLCSSATSDGVMVDSSPPLPGHVFDGMIGTDINYQASRSHIACKWYGFTDTQSGISHYVWRVGSAKGADDILTTTDVHTHEEAFILDLNQTTGILLPLFKQLYCTVRAYDKAGFFTESSSNGFIVDETSPVFIKPVSLFPIGSLVKDTSVLRSLLRVHWDVEDTESFIEEQYLSILSHTGGDFNISSIKIEGISRGYTFSNVDLHDGSYYDVKLVACNGAKLCSESVLKNVLVDSTPPTAGTFAINTDHASVLNRQPEDWMTWNVISISLAWLGFQDIHTGISHYIITIGSQYMGSDLHENIHEPYVLYHDYATNISHHEDSFVQTNTFRTQSLSRVKGVYISITGINKVGLSSPVVHSQFNLLYGGMLELVRRCDSHTCLGHCVCAPHGKLCGVNDTVCNDMTKDMNYEALIVVRDYLDLTFPEQITPPQHTPVNNMLAAIWTFTDKIPLWYEWSVGEADIDYPVGVFDETTERVWHDAANNTRWVYILPRGRNLIEHIRYSFFVRGWYDENTFAVYKSPGVTLFSTKPSTTSLRGRVVKERTHTSTKDVDYITRNTIVYADWTGKFLNTANSLARFHVYLSTVPYGHDKGVLSKNLPSTVTTLNLTGLTLDEHTRYYTVVQAYNLAGLYSTEVSDGFFLDDTPPTAGVVKHGYVSSEVRAFNSTDRIQAFWYGFSDLGSGIKTYEYCVSTLDSTRRCDIIDMTSVGIATRTDITSPGTFQHGNTYFSHVRARDAAGHVSILTSSNGAVIDTTSPTRVKLGGYEHNIVSSASFENTSDYSSCSGLSNTAWTTNDAACAKVVNTPYAQDGNNVLILRGTISQTIYVETSGKYQLTFYASTVNSETIFMSANEGFVDMNGNRNIFLLYSKPNVALYSWQFYTFSLDLNKGAFVFNVGTVNTRTIVSIDNIKLQRLIYSGDIESSTEGHVRASAVFIHDWSSIHANWDFVDEESDIEEYMWAIGTVSGGTQLQSFTSVGRQSFAQSSSLRLEHNTKVFVTVVAINGAGLRSVSLSDPVYVDLTPPVFQYVHDGTNNGEQDIDFQSSNIVTVNWDVSDPESGIDTCVWSIRTSTEMTLLEFSPVSNPTLQTASFDLHDEYNQTIHSVVRCTNKAGLTSTAISDGVTLLTNRPDSEHALLEVLTTSKTQFPTEGIYHGDRSRINLRWKDFNLYQNIKSYLVSIDGVDDTATHLSEIVNSDDANDYNYAGFIGLNLTDGRYTVSVIAINEVRMQSERKLVDVYILTKEPVLTGINMKTTWNRNNQVASASWEDVFDTEHPLYYEVTVRLLEQGDGDIVQWQETTNTYIEIKLDTTSWSQTGVTIRFSVRAVSYAGLFKSQFADLFALP